MGYAKARTRLVDSGLQFVESIDTGYFVVVDSVTTGIKVHWRDVNEFLTSQGFGPNADTKQEGGDT